MSHAPIKESLNLVILACAVFLCGAMLWIASHASSPFLVVLAAFGFGLFNSTLFSLMHEAVHGIFHKNAAINEAAGNITAAFFPSIFPIQRISHLTHHINNRSDVERFDYYETRDSHFLKTAQWYSILTGLYWLFIPVMLTAYTIFGNLIPWRKLLATDGWLGRQTSAKPYFEALQAIASWRIYSGFVLAVGVQFLLFYLLDLTFWGWAACYGAFGLMWSSLQYADHAFSPIDRIEGSWNLKVSGPVRLIYLNYYYHLVHHREAEIPWHALPEAAKPDDRGVRFWRMLMFMWTGPRPLPGNDISGDARRRHHLTTNLFLASIATIIFAVLYYAGSELHLTADQHYDLRIGLDGWIPFVPQMAIIYLAICPLLATAPFVLRTPERLLPFGLALGVELVIALAIYSLFPAISLEPTYSGDGFSGFFMSLADAINLEGNNFPSLHVALAVSAAWAYATVLDKSWHIPLWAGCALIISSTLFTHQHIIVDVIGGIVLALFAMGLVFPAVTKVLEEMRNKLGAAVKEPAGI